MCPKATDPERGQRTAAVRLRGGATIREFSAALRITFCGLVVAPWLLLRTAESAHAVLIRF
jgi:hypothetical protein